MELDGDSHAGQEVYDAMRSKFLEAKGYHVLRFTNADVIRNMDGVLTKLAKIVAELRAMAPPPTPSPEGEGA